MKTRILSGLVMVPFALFLYFGGYGLMALTMVISVIGLKEFYNGFEEMDIHPSKAVGFASIAVLYLMNGFMYYMGDVDPLLTLAWLSGVIIASSLYMFRIDQRGPVDAMATMVGIIYIVFFAFHVVLTDQLEELSILKWLIVITAFGSDIFAYFAGMLFGKHKLCEKLSPKKTVEGAIGGVLGSVLLSALFAMLFAKDYMFHAVIIGLLASPVSMFGDLTASAYKRKMGIKDYGNLIPGHGGIMDRFDSVLFTAPFVYYYIAIVMRYFLGM